MRWGFHNASVMFAAGEGVDMRLIQIDNNSGFIFGGAARLSLRAF